MADVGAQHRELEELTRRFTDAFNREDLDEVLSLMAEDAIYDQFDGTVARGKREIREAFVPQFEGRFGKMRFLPEDLFVDAAAGKALVRWVCSIDKDARKRSWRGPAYARSRARGRKMALASSGRACEGEAHVRQGRATENPR